VGAAGCLKRFFDVDRRSKSLLKRETLNLVPPFFKATVYTQVGWASFLDLNPPNPLKKLAQIRILVPLFKGDLGGSLEFALNKLDFSDILLDLRGSIN
jgi:hypothetical protein